MMAYPANEREWNQAEMAILIADYINKYHRISYAEAQRITGGSRFQIYRLFQALDRALRTIEDDGNGRALCK